MEIFIKYDYNNESWEITKYPNKLGEEFLGFKSTKDALELIEKEMIYWTKLRGTE